VVAKGKKVSRRGLFGLLTVILGAVSVRQQTATPIIQSITAQEDGWDINADQYLRKGERFILNGRGNNG